MIGAIVAVALIGSAIASGVQLATSLAFAPYARRLTYERYVQISQFMRPRFDRLMPATFVVTCAADTALAALVPAARTLFALAAGGIAAAVLVSVLRTAPAVNYVGTLDPLSPPDDWPARDPRAGWHHWHNVRCTTTVLALLADVTAVALLL